MSVSRSASGRSFLGWVLAASLLLTGAAPAAPLDDCDPSYPDVCIPAPPPDLDCPDIPHRDFRVVGPDPHHFDGDRDGVGCESRPR